MKDLSIIAAKVALEVYERNHKIGRGVEIATHLLDFQDRKLFLLAVAGTNGPLWDWYRNLDLRVENGLKRSSVRAARRIGPLKSPKGAITVVTGHSLGGSIALAHKQEFGFDYCFAWAPPPTESTKDHPSLDWSGTTVYLDPDDPVRIAGLGPFDHPDCTTVFAPDDPGVFNLEDHDMKNWLEFAQRGYRNGPSRCVSY